ncbi:MAG: helix-turn-helix domain-containing protein, partial [Bacteroidota bacterium]
MTLERDILSRSKRLFLRYGIRSVTMDDISKEMGISKKTLYQYVDNKADLIRRILYQTLQEEKAAQEKISQAAQDAIQEMIGIVKHVTKMLSMVPPSTLYDMQKYYRESWE